MNNRRVFLQHKGVKVYWVYYADGYDARALQTYTYLPTYVCSYHSHASAHTCYLYATVELNIQQPFSVYMYMKLEAVHRKGRETRGSVPRLQVCICVHIRGYVHVCMYACACACMYASVSIHVYVIV